MGVSSSNYTEWQNTGSVFDCSEWAPPEELVNLFESFVQSRECSQLQSRQRVDTLVSSQTGATREEGPFTETQSVQVNQSQDAVGTRDYILSEVNGQWSEWIKEDGLFACGEFTPSSDDVDFGVSYTKTRSCQQNESRSRSVFNEYRSGDQQLLRTETENRAITVVDSAQDVGTGADWQETSSTFSDWVNVGSPYDFQGWTPEATNQVADFEQVQLYSQDQSRSEQRREEDQVTGTIRNVGAPISQERTVELSDTRAVTVSFTDWVDSGSAYDCDSWPSINTSTTSNQEQVRLCSLDQSRTRSYSTGESFTETRTVSESESRSITASVGGYVDTTRTGFTNWSPSVNGQTSSFSQSHSYSQNQSATITYSDGASTVGTGTLTRSLPRTESRTVTVSVGAWVNSGGVYNCSGYTPAASTQTSNFVQTFTCSQNQTRVRSYSTGESVTEDRTISSPQSRTVVVSAGAPSNSSSGGSWSPNPGNQTGSYTQTRNVDTTTSVTYSFSTGGSHTVTSSSNDTQSRTVGVLVGEYTNVGSVNGCSSWEHTSFTSNPATRTCNQAQSATWTHSVGGAVIYTRSESRNVTVAQTASPSGASTESYSSYTNYGPETCGSYSPAPNEVLLGLSYFAEAKCTRTRERTVTVLTPYSNGITYVTDSYTDVDTQVVIKTKFATGTLFVPGFS